MKKAITVFVSWVLMLGVLCGATFYGCSGPKDNVTISARDTTTKADIGVAGLKERIKAAEDNVQKAKDHIEKSGAPLLESASDNHKAALERLKEVEGALWKLRDDFDVIDKDYSRVLGDYKNLESKWYVKVGKFITRMFWFIVFGWAILGLGGAALTAFFPGGGIAYTVGKELIRLLPFSNPFSWIRGLMGGDSAVKAAAGSSAPAVINLNVNTESK